MNLYLLGATGSIGEQTCDIIRQSNGFFKLVSATAHSNIEKLEELINEFHPKYIAVAHEKDAQMLQAKYPDIECGFGRKGYIDAATYGSPGEDLVVNAIVGSAGLEPTVHAIKYGRNIALANKETLVVGGEIIKPLLKKHKVRLIPIDSEHSAIMQCLNGEEPETISSIIITASGGSFRDKTREELESVTVENALDHPNWSMGAKITIDSATMMNKGLEVIEAHYLFDVPYENIKTVLHRESIIHSMVELHDTSIIAHLGYPDMRIPISYALHYPKRASYKGKSLNLFELGHLHFEELSTTRYPLLGLAQEVGKKGGYYPCVMNAANEAAVQLFLQGRISFLQIEEIVIQCVNTLQYDEPVTLEKLLEVDRVVKDYVINKY
jgi:1-deoxy-D-xylulose-5-phosphate reductoisomerase